MDLQQAQHSWQARMVTARRRRKAATEELERRSMDALRVYEPMPSQKAFHASKAPVRVIRAGNRSGKTYAVAQETARAARRMDPHGKYPTDRGLFIWIIVFEEDNIGRTIFRMLFQPGCGNEVFIIRDEETGKWRTWSEGYSRDRERIDERIVQPPLIPPEEIVGGSTGMSPAECKGFSWTNKGARIFKVCRLKNGTEIRCYCSGSEPPMGDSVDLAVIDEDLKQDRRMVSELMARISTRGGRIIWSVWPKTKNIALQKLSKEAALQAGLPNPDIAEFRMKYSENMFISEEKKQITLRLWASQGEDVLKSRDEGDFGLDAVLMYPEFDLAVHAVPNVPDPKCLDRSRYHGNIDWFLRTREIPQDWCRFLWIDPGYTRMAVLWMAIQPPSLGDFVVAYRELYLTQKTYATVAKEVARLSVGEQIRLFGIDDQQARKHSQQTGKTEKQQLSDEFKKVGMRSITTGFGFKKGSTNIQGRCAMVRSWLSLRYAPG